MVYLPIVQLGYFWMYWALKTGSVKRVIKTLDILGFQMLEVIYAIGVKSDFPSYLGPVLYIHNISGCSDLKWENRSDWKMVLVQKGAIVSPTSGPKLTMWALVKGKGLLTPCTVTLYQTIQLGKMSFFRVLHTNISLRKNGTIFNIFHQSI